MKEDMDGLALLYSSEEADAMGFEFNFTDV
jgi:hypothetical protein